MNVEKMPAVGTFGETSDSGRRDDFTGPFSWLPQSAWVSPWCSVLWFAAYYLVIACTFLVKSAMCFGSECSVRF